MLGEITAGAYALDQWLKAHVGRLYTMVLGSCLVLGIIAALRNLEQTFGSAASLSAGNASALVGAVVVQLALLINQLAQLHEYRQAARERRAARRERRAAAKAERKP